MKSKFIPYYMAIAYETAKLSSAERAQVGAVIVKDNRIISIGYNGMPSGWSNQCEYIVDTKSHTKPEVLHAETNAIAKVAQSTESSKGATLFCTHTPCLECAKLIHQAGISSVYYDINYEAAKGSGKQFLEKSNIEVKQCQV
jgi:dCMP deaminase